MADTFSQRPGLAAAYKQYRPKYSRALFDELVGLLEQEYPGPYNQAVDVGCKSGQFTYGLSPHFNKVLGIDISPAQIEQANQNKAEANITYSVGSFDKIPLPDGSCEMVTAFRSAQWFDPLNKFYSEADRVLKPGGMLVVGAHNIPTIHVPDVESDELHNIYKEFIETLKPYRTSQNLRVENFYEDWELPYETTRMEDLGIAEFMSLQQFAGYLRTLSYYVKYRENHKNEEDPVDVYLKGVLQELGKPDAAPEDIQVQAMWRIFYLFGRKPKN